MNIENLNEQYGIAGKVQFENGKGNLPVINIHSNYASAVICLYGAQILSYQPTGQPDLLWVSERSLFQNGKAIRGGIPLCFPWFGPHPVDKTKPQHGFARLQYWQVSGVTATAGESISITLSLKESEASLQLWPCSFHATIQFIIGNTLDVKLTVTNTGSDVFEYSDALHTYFNISNISTVALEGLQHADYFDAFGTALQQQEDHLLHFDTETNRRYVNTSANCIIHDKGYNRKIQVNKAGSKVTIVWNPAADTTKTMGDMEPDGYSTFVCVEPANAYTGIDMIELKPGESHTLSTQIGLLV